MQWTSQLSNGDALLGSETFVNQSQNHIHARWKSTGCRWWRKYVLSSLRKQVLSCHLDKAQHLHTFINTLLEMMEWNAWLLCPVWTQSAVLHPVSYEDHPSCSCTNAHSKSYRCIICMACSCKHCVLHSKILVVFNPVSSFAFIVTSQVSASW